MPILKVVFNNTTKVARVLNSGAATPGSFVDVGTFTHPDATYPDCTEVYHGVRDLLYKRSAANPANTAKYPDNICNMQAISIDFQAAKRLAFILDLQNSLLVTSGDDIRLAVDAVGGVDPLTYQWFLADVAVSGATSKELILKDIDTNRDGVYHAKVTDNTGTFVLSGKCNVVVSTPTPLTAITPSPTSIALSVAADTANGKKVTFAQVPAGANLGVLTIKTAPLATRATATITNNVLTIKPVAAGTATPVVVTNGAFDITINITVAA